MTSATFYGRDELNTVGAFVAAFLIGLAFGFFLERAGFGSSRRLAGVFYFRDLAVIKVMFTAVITAMLGLLYLTRLGLLSADDVYYLPTVFGAQVVGGLVFGCGFVMSGWCPGTAAVGLASGKWDAGVFLGGALVGSVLFNELFALVAPLYQLGESGVRFVWRDLGIPEAQFALAFAAIAVAMFWGAEWLERRRQVGGEFLHSRFLKSASVALVALAAPLALFGGASGELPDGPTLAVVAEKPVRELLPSIEAGEDHVDPEDLADRLMSADPRLLVIDIRYPEEFDRYHLPTAVNVAMQDLPVYLHEHQGDRDVVLYSNGMTHPAQARDELTRGGFRNVFILTDGLGGFIHRCLRPVSLRTELLTREDAERIRRWRAFFLGAGEVSAEPDRSAGDEDMSRIVDVPWLASRLGRADLRIIDARPQPQYNSGHVPGAVCVSPESLRGVQDGVSSMLLPAELLAAQFSLMGIGPGDFVVLITEEKLQDATLIALALERLGHRRYAILDGGFTGWQAQGGAVTSDLPKLARADYPVPAAPEGFTVSYATVLDAVTRRTSTILDVRPHEYFTGAKSDEARSGHIPGAINRPLSDDVITVDGATHWKPVGELAEAYARLIPAKDSPVIVYCRTGHQASQTFYLLRNLLGYKNVRWYDGSWSEWSARPELPIERPEDVAKSDGG